jgi:excisionase family DNA binding protein
LYAQFVPPDCMRRYLADNDAVMTGRSSRGRWERVVAARRQARVAQGRDPGTVDAFDAPPKRKTALLPEPLTQTPIPSGPSASLLVLSLGEAALALGVSRAKLGAMIDAGQVEALPTGYTRMIPRREVERLARDS